MTKSASNPTFLAMLVSGRAVAGRDSGPSTGARNHVTSGGEHNNVQSIENKNDDDNNNNNENENDDEDADDDDEDDEMKRQRIENWLQHLETVVLDRPASPVIDDDVPPQTDTAIHIVYNGD